MRISSVISIEHVLPKREESKGRDQNLCGKLVDEEDSYQQQLQKPGYLSTRKIVINTYLTTSHTVYNGSQHKDHREGKNSLQ